MPGIGVSIASLLLYFSIYNSPSELNLESPNDIDKNNPNKRHENPVKWETLKALLQSPFLWILCVNYMIVLFIKAGVSDWGQLYLMQGKGKSQYDGEFNSYISRDFVLFYLHNHIHIILVDYAIRVYI